MIVAHSPTDQARVFRESAAKLMARLGLAGFDNASIAAADAWIDSDEFRAHWSNGSVSTAFDVAAYLGEAIIQRHGGSWSLGTGGPPCVAIHRNGHHIIDPFNKVRKRAENGHADHLLGLVDLAGHVTTKPQLEPDLVASEAFAALDSVDERARMSGGRALLLLLLSLIGFPLVVLVALLLTIDATYGLIGGGCAIPLGFGVFAILARITAPRLPSAPYGTRGWEAKLTIPALVQRLQSKLEELDPYRPSQDALEEIVFYTAQLRDLRETVMRRDPSPGRGYIGFDTYREGWVRRRSP